MNETRRTNTTNRNSFRKIYRLLDYNIEIYGVDRIDTSANNNSIIHYFHENLLCCCCSIYSFKVLSLEFSTLLEIDIKKNVG